VKRLFVVFISALALFTTIATLGSSTRSWAASSSSPQIIFDDSAQQAELVIPTPACPESQSECQWKFVLQIPKGDVTVGVLYGTSGTLVIPYPPKFCGVIQADAYQGPPFVPERGFQHTIATCDPATTTTTSTTTTSTTTSTTVPTTVPPVAAPKASPPPAPPVAAPTPPAPAPVSATPTQLPFTGVNTTPILFVGLTLVVLGLALLASASSRRRVVSRLLATMRRPG
jgi:hypothetical protein